MFARTICAVLILLSSHTALAAESVLQAAQRQEAIAAAKEQDQIRGALPPQIQQQQAVKPARSESDDYIIGIGGYGTNLRAELFYKGVTTPVITGDALSGGWSVHKITPNKVTLAQLDKKGKVVKTRDLSFVGYAPIPTDNAPVPHGAVMQGGPNFVPAIIPNR